MYPMLGEPHDRALAYTVLLDDRFACCCPCTSACFAVVE
jgi:hypothetical protein